MMPPAVFNELSHDSWFDMDEQPGTDRVKYWPDESAAMRPAQPKTKPNELSLASRHTKTDIFKFAHANLILARPVKTY